jgi:integrase
MVVAKRLGHSKVSVTLDTYGHLIPELHDDVAQFLDDLITPTEINLPELIINNKG